MQTFESSVVVWAILSKTAAKLSEQSRAQITTVAESKGFLVFYAMYKLLLVCSKQSLLGICEVIGVSFFLVEALHQAFVERKLKVT